MEVTRGLTPAARAEAQAKRAITHAKTMEAKAASVIRFGDWLVCQTDELNWSYWNARKDPEGKNRLYFPDFQTALQVLGRKLASDGAVRAGGDLKKWLAGCERIAQAIEKIRIAP